MGLTDDMLIAYTAVMCAVLALRSTYTLTVLLIQAFRFLQHAVALLLIFIGGKIAMDVGLGVVLPTHVVLWVIVVMLSGGVTASLVLPRAN